MILLKEEYETVQHHMYELFKDGCDYCVPITRKAHMAYHSYNHHNGINGTGDHGMGDNPGKRTYNNKFLRKMGFYEPISPNIRLHELITYNNNTGNVNIHSGFEANNGKKILYLDEHRKERLE